MNFSEPRESLNAYPFPEINKRLLKPFRFPTYHRFATFFRRDCFPP